MGLVVFQNTKWVLMAVTVWQHMKILNTMLILTDMMLTVMYVGVMMSTIT